MKRNGSYARRKGHAEERLIINELNELYGVDSLVSSRSESKRLDDAGIDIVDPDNLLPVYIQCKRTQSTPSVDLIKNCKRKEKPLAIVWNKQIKKEKNCVSSGSFVIMEKSVFYNLLEHHRDACK